MKKRDQPRLRPATARTIKDLQREHPKELVDPEAIERGMQNTLLNVERILYSNSKRPR